MKQYNACLIITSFSLNWFKYPINNKKASIILLELRNFISKEFYSHIIPSQFSIQLFLEDAKLRLLLV